MAKKKLPAEESDTPAPTPEVTAPGLPPAPVEKKYYLVNPHGAIHIVSREHARARLAQVGWRLATKDEAAGYDKAHGLQRWDKPIARPWTPDPDKQLDLE